MGVEVEVDAARRGLNPFSCFRFSVHCDPSTDAPIGEARGLFGKDVLGHSRVAAGDPRGELVD